MIRGVGVLGGGKDALEQTFAMNSPVLAAALLRAEERERLQEIRDIVITSVNNVPIRIDDIVQGGPRLSESSRHDEGVVVSHQTRLGRVGLDRALDAQGNGWERHEEKIQGIILMRKGEQSLPALKGVKEKFAELNQPGKLPPGVEARRRALRHRRAANAERRSVRCVANAAAGCRPVAGGRPSAHASPATKEVTAASSVGTASLPPNPAVAAKIVIDFAHVKQQLPMQRVLEHLGLASKLRGPGAQKRCACPIHRADGRGRTFSVNLAQNVFHCFEASCQKKGDVIDLWAALHGLDVRAAALDLVQTFDLEPTPATERRHG